MKVETRKVQLVGHSTLMVSLPREWVNQVGLAKGDTLTLEQDDDGLLHILPMGRVERKEAVKCVLDADKCDMNGLLTRIITGVYIIGHETLEIISKRGLETEQLAEIRQSVQRLTGMSIVEQDFNRVLVKNFVDPTRFPTSGLLRRIYIITSWMQEAAIQALNERRKDLATEVIHMESEVDRIYWLVVRQMLLAVKDRSVAKKIGIDSPAVIVSDRTIAKVLEKIGDLSESIAKEAITIIESEYPPSESVLDGLSGFFKQVHSVYEKAVSAFFTKDINTANDAIEIVDGIKNGYEKTVDTILSDFKRSLEEKERNGGVTLEKVDTYVGLRAILWNLLAIAGYCGTIAEITINSALEKGGGNVCTFEAAKDTADTL